ncbi:MAG TPA: adenylate/guanylate cyclase domain-containing protein [Fimbriimonas sp.]
MVRWRSNSLRTRNLVRFLSIQFVATFAAGVFLRSFPQLQLPLVAEAFLFGIPASLMVTLVVRVLFPRLNPLPYLPSVLLRAGLLVASIAAGFAIGLYLLGHAHLNVGAFDPAALKFMQSHIWRVEIRYTAVFVFIAILVYAAFEQLTRRLGPGVLESLLLGKYHHPRREERIFLFMDLKRSTQLAEQLGDLKYSALMRDYFSDLTLAILESRASVAEYVGDEIVLTWPIRRGLAHGRCLGAYLVAKDTMARRAEWYRHRYGVVPDFKAGMHCGWAVATEVGEVKTEIVYHGDVLNTTSRIQSLCNEIGVDLVISEELANRLPPVPGIALHSLGAYELRGKDRAVSVSTLAAEIPVAAIAPALHGDQ